LLMRFSFFSTLSELGFRKISISGVLDWLEGSVDGVSKV